MIKPDAVFKDGKCLLRFKNTGSESVEIIRIAIAPEPFASEGCRLVHVRWPIPAGKRKVRGFTRHLIKYVAANAPQERKTELRLEFKSRPEHKIPDLQCWVVSRRRKIVGFRWIET